MNQRSLQKFRGLVVLLTLVGLPLAGAAILAALQLEEAPEPRALIHPASQTQLAAAQPADVRDVPNVLLDNPPDHDDQLDSPFVRVADAVIPAVVSVEAFRFIEADESHLDVFRRMYERRGEGSEERFEVPSAGSGFIIDDAGYVLTNDHVVAGAERITVHLADGRNYDAYLLGSDPGTDIAVLKISVPFGHDSLPTLPLGNSDAMRVGDWAIAVGNPLGELESSFTVGVVSATGRNNLRIAGGGPTYQDFIQTDASINFGNSGGPLVNLRGEAIGINSAVNPTGQGLGFAIPLNMVREVAVELIQSGTVRRGYLGIWPRELSDDTRRNYDIDDDVVGVLVGQVEDDTPAQDSGFREGDVILRFNRSKVADVPEFRQIVADAGVGADVPVRVLRDGRERDLNVVLALRPDTPEPPRETEPMSEEDWLGLELSEITPELMALYNLQQTRGVVCSQVSLGRPAASSGLRVGDVVLEVNDRKIKDIEDFRDAMTDAVQAGESLEIEVRRGNSSTTIEVETEG